MGTNFFWVPDKCEHCDRYDERFHICKSLTTFQAYKVGQGPNWDSVDTWKRWKAIILNGGYVVDEYGEWYEPEEFIDMVETKSTPEQRRQKIAEMASERMANATWGLEAWADQEDYYFVQAEFS